jgi:hypothetical protein
VHGGFIPLILMLIGGAIALAAVTVLVMAWSLVHPPRMTDGKAAWVLRRLSPGDLGLRFEDLHFEIHDRTGSPLRLAAWWIPHPNANGRCAVLVHGYADAKVGAIAWAPPWHALGYNLLVPDLRAHGESGGTVCTAGDHERQDLSQLIDQLLADRPEDTRELVLFGISMGAAVAGALATERDDIAAVVMESPYADFRHAALAHMDLMGLPGRALQRMALLLAQWLTRADFSSANPAQQIPRMNCPVLLIESGQDALLLPEDRAALESAVRLRGEPSAIWRIEGVEHLMAIVADPAAYQERLARFFASVATRGARVSSR